MLKHILVVCVGNICRSPMAKGVFNKRLQEIKIDTVEVRTAGLAALCGQPADKMARRLVQNEGIDVSEHRAQQLTPELIRWADLILVMEEMHRKSIEAMAPYARGKIYRLGGWNNVDVDDPYRKSEEVYKESLELINQGVSSWVEKL